MRYVSIATALMLAAATPVWSQLDEKVADRLWESAKVLGELANAPDGGVLTDLLQSAECVAVIPAVKRAALGFGGRYGRGTVTCRNQKGVWGPPSMLSLSGGSFGLQLGGQSVDVVMLFMTPESIKHLLKDKFTLGADASAAAGPKGRAVSAETSVTMRAEILSYARSRGLFAGISLRGAVLRPDQKANESLYGREVAARVLLADSGIAVPEAARTFIQTVSEISGGSN